MCSNRREYRSRGRLSLRARLLIGQAILLVAVVGGIGVASEFGLQKLVVDQLDTQLMDFQDRTLLELGGGPRLGPPPQTPITTPPTTDTPTPTPQPLPSVAPTTQPEYTPPSSAVSVPHPHIPGPPAPGEHHPGPGGAGVQSQSDSSQSGTSQSGGSLSGNSQSGGSLPGNSQSGGSLPGNSQPGGSLPDNTSSGPGGSLGHAGPSGGGGSSGGGGGSTHSAQVFTQAPNPHPGRVGSGPAFLDRGGVQSGAIGAIIDQGRVRSAGRIEPDGTDNDLSARAKRQLTALAAMDHPTTVTIDGAGHYRIMVDRTWQHTILITGLPMAPVDVTLMRGLMISGIITVVALIIAIAAGVLVIRRALAPLDRVARTAVQVSDLPLDRGEVTLPVRVPAADAVSNTEVGQLGSAINRMLDHIADALLVRHASETRARRFLADASHELRTPLAAIRGYAELVYRNRETLPAYIATVMERLDAAAHRMSDLVEDMLLLARLDAGRPLELGPVDLSRLTVDALADAHIADPDKIWDLDLPDGPLLIHGDAAQLHQVLANLLANARVHTPPGTTVMVSLEFGDPDGAVWRVCDDGPGIPQDVRSEIFERFARGDASRSRHAGSTGLGLAIAAAVVKAHNGTITVDSIPGCTAFTVHLPVGEVAVSTDASDEDVQVVVSGHAPDGRG